MYVWYGLKKNSDLLIMASLKAHHVMVAFLWLQVQLSSDNSDASIFKVLPRYKVKSEGDQVL